MDKIFSEFGSPIFIMSLTFANLIRSLFSCYFLTLASSVLIQFLKIYLLRYSSKHEVFHNDYNKMLARGRSKNSWPDNEGMETNAVW